MAKLYCVGVGPGDPELLTIKAKRLIEEADVIFCPTSRKGKESIALSIVKPIIELRKKDVEIVELVFPMIKDKSVLENVWEENAKIIVDKCKDLSVYLCVGDPSLYSTFSHIHKRLIKYNIDIEIVPGITSISSFAAEAKISLAEGDDIISIIPACYDLERASKIAELSDTLIFLKDGRYFTNVIKVLKGSKFKKGKLAIAENVSTTNKISINDIDKIEEVPVERYFSIMVAKNEW